MTPASFSATTERRVDHFRVASGALGPIPVCDLEVRPLTVFVGPQGAGKSLVAQLLFALEELPFLLYTGSLERGWARKSPEDAFRWVLDRLRSADRAFAVFASPRARIEWVRGSRTDWPTYAPESFAFSMYRATRAVNLDKTRTAFVKRLSQENVEERPDHHAIYFPTERLSIAGRRSSLTSRAFPQPITYEVFEHWLEDHVELEAAKWPKGVPKSELGRFVAKLGAASLQGSARKHGERWKWQFKDGEKTASFDIDMASAGQRANFTIPLIASVLPELRDTQNLATQITLLIEEPEISLHPDAQWQMLKILVALVNAGFRVVLTTHSISFLYAINNLLQAFRVGTEAPELPDKRLWLNPEDVSVYAFHPNRKPEDLVDRKAGFIDERELGRTGELLANELSRISALLPPEAVES